ncbi:MAG: hypothetical protein NVV62_08500 [Terricaulis sp.]|nr:hypothetical protein [Terricaulis sp.]
MAVIITWIILCFWPRYGLLLAVGAMVAAYNLIGAFTGPAENTNQRLFELAVVLPTFLVIGAGIISARRWLQNRKKTSDLVPENPQAAQSSEPKA